MKIFTVIGARPQFIKASVVSLLLSKNDFFKEIILHTGQHFDTNMSDIFFDQLKIPRPKINLNINGGSHGQMTSLMLKDIESSLLDFMPDRVLLYGDTNSTLAGALAASKLGIPIAHIEAGLRSFNMSMPEEINRIVTDQLSDLLFCPTDIAVNNLNNEGLNSRGVNIIKVGDVMKDASLIFAKKAAKPLVEIPENFILATLHRAENTNDKERLKEIITALNVVHNTISPVVMPLHPRTKELIKNYQISVNFITTDPFGYFEILWMLKNCSLVVTDSGGMQKEALFFGKACITTRDQTEWKELIDHGYNVLVGANKEKIIYEIDKNINRVIIDKFNLYGDGNAADKIVKKLI